MLLNELLHKVIVLEINNKFFIWIQWGNERKTLEEWQIYSMGLVMQIKFITNNTPAKEALPFLELYLKNKIHILEKSQVNVPINEIYIEIPEKSRSKVIQSGLNEKCILDITQKWLMIPIFFKNQLFGFTKKR